MKIALIVAGILALMGALITWVGPYVLFAYLIHTYFI